MFHDTVKGAEVTRNETDKRVLHADIEMRSGDVHRFDIVFKDEPATERINAGRIQKGCSAASDGPEALAAWARKRRATMRARGNIPAYLAAGMAAGMAS